MPGGQALDQQRQRGVGVQAVGDRVRLGGGRGRQLGVAARGQQRHDPVALLEPVSGLGHRARHLAAQDERQLALGHVLVLALVGVAEVHARARHADQQLALAGDRVGHVGDPEHLGAAELGDLDGSHG